MKQSTVTLMLRYGRFVMLGVILAFLYLDSAVLDEVTFSFALVGKYVQLFIGFAIMHYVYKKQINTMK